MASWKTSVIGLLIGGLNMLANGTNWKQVAVSVGFAVFGVLSKDFDITGTPPTSVISK